MFQFLGDSLCLIQGGEIRAWHGREKMGLALYPKLAFRMISESPSAFRRCQSGHLFIDRKEVEVRKQRISGQQGNS